MGLSRLLICLILMALIHRIHAQSSPQDFLNAHNAARTEVGVPPLVWDNNLALFAQTYGQARARDCEMIHSGSGQGENLAAGSWAMSAQEAVSIWVEERNMYDYKANACTGGDYACLHYTQVVWRSSARVGCATTRCVTGWTFVNCNYDPPGNYIGERPF